MKLFAVHFRDHVVPRLRNLARAEAVCVARNVETFDGACEAVERYARRYGCYHMNDDHLYELIEWIAITVLEEIDAAEASGAP